MTEWQAADHTGAGNVAELLGSLRGRAAIVCRRGEGIFQEYGTARGRLDNPVPRCGRCGFREGT